MKTVKIEIYTAMFCGYCIQAKSLLMKKGVPFEEFDVTFNGGLRQKMQNRSKRLTVPQIFIAGKAIGGSDELLALEREGKLDALLGIE